MIFKLFVFEYWFKLLLTMVLRIRQTLNIGKAVILKLMTSSSKNTTLKKKFLIKHWMYQPKQLEF